MQPDNEPRTAGPPEPRDPAMEPASPLPTAPATSSPSGLGRRNVVVLLLFAVLLAVGGLAVAGVVWYDRQTAPDRSAPDVAADNYLRALLVERDDARAALWACGDRSGLAEIEAFRREIGEREADLGTSISVNLEDLRVDERADIEALLTVGVRRSAVVDGTSQSVVDQFRVRTVNNDGWRVCSVEKVPS